MGRAGSLVAILCSAVSQPALAQAMALPNASQSSTRPEPSGPDGQTTRARQTILGMPLVRDGRPLGELEVWVLPDGSARFGSASLRNALLPLLSQTGVDALDQAIGGQEFVEEAPLTAAGFVLRFDMSRLEVVLDSIDPSLRTILDLDSARSGYEAAPPTVDAAGFSAYLTLAGNFEYAERETGADFTEPDVLAFGAMRAGRFGLEYEGGLSERAGGSYGLYRRFVRGIYEIEEKNFRFSAGDLQTETFPILGSQRLGGIGVERRKRIFSPFDPVFQLGGRQILINSPSTIEIVNNGQVVRSISVDEGAYNLEELPLNPGSNNVDIVIRDAAGRTSVTNFNYFYDPVDLEVGDYEYGAYIGLSSDLGSIEPQYTTRPVATGFYRKAFTPSLLIGGAIQASENNQAAALDLRWVPQVVPGAFETQIAASNSDDGLGVAARLGYRWSRGIGSGTQQAAVIVDYESAEFNPVERSVFLRESRFSISANYGQSLSRKSFLSAGVNYFERGNSPKRVNAFAEVIRQFTPLLRGVVGAEYGKGDGFESSFGVKVGLTMLLGRSSRASGAFESRRDLYRAAYSKGLEDRVGAFGYDASIQSSNGRSLADASLRYRGNRFDARFLVSGSGDGIGNIGDTRRAQMQVSTSLAYADGVFGVGRPINDGFAILSPHPSIKGEVIVGNRLNGGEYQAKSGLLGGAVVPNVIGYQTRELLYDIDSDETIYNTGNGTDRVRVPSRGGAKITVGDFRSVSVLGTVTAGGEPIAFASGTITSETDEGFPTGQFFTNYRGRYAMIGLAPGEEYTITLSDGRKFRVDIPEDTEGLLRMSDISIEEVRK